MEYTFLPPKIGGSSFASQSSFNSSFSPLDYKTQSTLMSPPPLRDRGSLGYLVFPPSSPQSPEPSFTSAEVRSPPRREEERGKVDEENKAWEARLERAADLHQQKLAEQEEEGQRGEEEWVRSGGILRDKNGRRDYKRTESVREELRLREVERILRERWETYERRWTELLANPKGKDARPPERTVRFNDIPWPVHLEDEAKAIDISDLTLSRVEEFLMGPLKVRGYGVSKRERVRASLLRWHPDKMTALHGRVVEEDLETVRKGINAVMVCLQHMNSSSA
ncbi:hypothetical protein BD779DRAFT_1675530 [Infundibulicybe gibba]|nr:hypothetical protein BD779DRAFT_1675530 [Infundibulicybe gibba]